MHTTVSKITINSPAEKVWQFLTKPELVKKWQYDSDITTDWKVGSPIVFRNEFDGQVFEQKGEVKIVNPYTRIQYTLFSPRPGLDDKPENYFVMTYDLKEDAGHTELTITQDDPRPQDPTQPAGGSDDEYNILPTLKGLVEG